MPSPLNDDGEARPRDTTGGWTVSTATRRGDRATNQDQILVVDGAIAVLDGATSWLPHDHRRDGGWYSRVLAGVLARRLPGHDRPLAEHLAGAIGELRDTFDLDPATTPYSTAAVVRWDEQHLDALVLGDSPVVVHRRAGGAVDALADDRLEPVAADIRERYRQHLRAGHGFDEEFASIIAELQTAERRHRNREGGFWVAGAEPSAAHRAVVGRWAADDVEAVLVMTDGIAAAVREYGLADWPSLVQQARSAGVAAVLAAVHDAEATDHDGRRWPRTKRHDDKAVALLARIDGV